jgi:lipopolysaccharide transport system ATP-binding protein
MAEQYRNAELPFKVYDVPDFDAVSRKWDDSFLSREFRKLGTTLLIVSHDKQAIQSICDRAILLNAGKLTMEGEPETVMDYYNAMLADRENINVKQETRSDGTVQTLSGSGEMVIEVVELLNVQNKIVEVINVGEPVTLRVQYKSQEPVSDVTIGFMVKDRLGQPVFGTNTHHLKHKVKHLQVAQTAVCAFSFKANFGVGSYSVAVAMHSGDTHVIKNYEWRDLATVFYVINLDKPEFVGVAWVPVSVSEQAL